MGKVRWSRGRLADIVHNITTLTGLSGPAKEMFATTSIVTPTWKISPKAIEVRAEDGCGYVSVGNLARGNAAVPAALPRASPAPGGVAGARCPRDSRQDAGGTTQGATTKAAAPINLFNLPMILHGRDAPAEAGLPDHREAREGIWASPPGRGSSLGNMHSGTSKPKRTLLPLKRSRTSRQCGVDNPVDKSYFLRQRFWRK